MPAAGPQCPYCGNHSRLADAGEVYGPTYDGRFNLWVCAEYPACDSYVGVHRNSPSAAPLGTLANKHLRGLRMRVHALLDPIWKGENGRKPKFKRAQVYAWLSLEMGMEPGKCHVSWFTEDQCLKALVILTEKEQKVCRKKSHLVA